MKRLALGGAVGAAFILCWVGAGLEPSSLLDPANLRAVAAFVRGLFPPDLSPGFLRVAAGATVRTLAISVVGTALSAILGLCLGVLATASRVEAWSAPRWPRSRAASAAEPGGAVPATASIMFDPEARLRPLRALAYAVARATLALLRSIPELVWVLLCILAVGLGPFAGVLALGLHTAGVLGKLYAETLEEVPCPRGSVAAQAGSAEGARERNGSRGGGRVAEAALV